MEQGNKAGVNVILREFKTDYGNINFPAVLSIPIMERLPEMAKKDFTKTIALITVALTNTFEGMNLKMGMNEIQILDLAEAIIDSSNEDYLAFEDLMLFLQKLIRGEYGSNYNSMDIPKFMISFEVYREQRWQELNKIRNEAHIQNKTTGDTGRVAQPDQLSEHFASMGDRLSSMKNTIGKLKEENKNLKMDNL